MRAPYTQLYLHLIWATWDRLPLLTPDIESQVYACIAKKCHDLKCRPLAIGGIEDHLHVLTRFHTTVSVAHLVKEVKGSSSHFVTHVLKPDDFFKWQGAYGAFTLRKSDMEPVKAYIENQKEHHRAGRLVEEWEQVFEVDRGE
jgi:REP element-mobilizing transposase RayT